MFSVRSTKESLPGYQVQFTTLTKQLILSVLYAPASRKSSTSKTYVIHRGFNYDQEVNRSCITVRKKPIWTDF